MTIQRDSQKLSFSSVQQSHQPRGKRSGRHIGLKNRAMVGGVRGASLGEASKPLGKIGRRYSDGRRMFSTQSTVRFGRALLFRHHQWLRRRQRVLIAITRRRSDQREERDIQDAQPAAIENSFSLVLRVSYSGSYRHQGLRIGASLL